MSQTLPAPSLPIPPSPVALSPAPPAAAVPDVSPGLIDRLRAALGMSGVPAATVAKIPTPEETIATLTTERERLAARCSALTDQLEGVKTTLATEQTALATARATLAGIEALVPGITTAEKPSLPLARQAAQTAAGIVATMGLPEGTAPAAAAPGTDPAGRTLSRAEFDNLSFDARNKHIRAGGKVSE